MALHSSHWGVFDATMAGGTLQVRPDPDDPDPAPLLRNIPAAATARARVMAPHVRRGWLDGGPGPDPRRGQDTYVPVSWDAVTRLLGGELRRVVDTHGNAAVYGGSYGWASAGRFHHAQSQLHRFLNLLGGYTGSAHTYSHGASEVLLPHVVGSIDPIEHPTAWPMLVGHTELLVCFGGMPAKNAQVSSGGVSRHVVAGNLAELHRRGARFVLFSPVRDDLDGGLEPDWHPLVPGTDTAVLLALAYVLANEDRCDRAFVTRYCTGYGVFERYLLGAEDGVAKTPAWAERISGIPAAAIAGLAREMARRRTLVSVSWSLQRTRFGEQTVWAAVALAAMLGQLGLPGGGFGHGYGAVGGAGTGRVPYPLPRFPQGSNPVRGRIPVARVADMLLEPGGAYEYNGEHRRYPDVRLVYWSGGNPFHHHQDLTRLRRAFGRPETVVVHDPFWTATARHADVVLPATTTLERNDLGAANRDAGLFAMRKVIDPLGESRDDYRIFGDLAAQLGVGKEFTEGRDERAWLAHLYTTWRAGVPAEYRPEEDFDAFWAAGRIRLRGARDDHVLFAGFRADPQGAPLATPSGRIELYSETIAGFGYDDCPGHPTWLPPEDLAVPPGSGEYPLQLVANNPATRLHSQLDHGALSAGAKVRGREPVRVHPADAAARGVGDGDVVVVRSSRGSCLAGVVVSGAVRQGVVQLSTGAWLDPSPDGAVTCVHGNVNVLTRDLGTSRLAQGCTGQHARVEVEPFRGPLPPVRAFDAPGPSPAGDPAGAAGGSPRPE